MAVPSFAFINPLQQKKDGEFDWKQAVFQVANFVAKVAPVVIREAGVAIPVYGNYCGPHHGDPAYAEEPIDAVDGACKKHDRCYEGLYQSCDCDVSLVSELKQVLATNQELSAHAISAGLAMITWFSQAPCRTL